MYPKGLSLMLVAQLPEQKKWGKQKHLIDPLT
jgi:hypothetical protein